MPHLRSKARNRRPAARRAKTVAGTRAKPGTRYTVGLPSPLAVEVQRYADIVDTSMSKAIAALVRLGLESQSNRKREFFERLKKNLASDDLGDPDGLVDEFRKLILGR